MQNIKDKVVVITGASSCLGEATAKMLAAECAVVVLGTRRKDRIQALVKEIEDNSGKALALTTDVTGAGQVKHW